MLYIILYFILASFTIFLYNKYYSYKLKETWEVCLYILGAPFLFFLYMQYPEAESISRFNLYTIPETHLNDSQYYIGVLDSRGENEEYYYVVKRFESKKYELHYIDSKRVNVVVETGLERPYLEVIEKRRLFGVLSGRTKTLVIPENTTYKEEK